MERTKTFVNGGRVYPADLNAIEDRAAEMLEGTAAAIPSSHFAGRYYRATDTGDLYLDNGTIWKKIAGKEAIESENIKNAAVTDAKVATSRVLINTGNSYVIKEVTKAQAEAGVTPSASRPAFVSLSTGSPLMIEVTVGGIGIRVGLATYSFYCPAGQAWSTNQALISATVLL